jgi:hypothetical protein
MGRAEHGLIQAYLVELRLSVADLPDAEEIVAEAEDHLLEAATRHGEQEALARFGTPSLVSATFIKEARKGSAVATTFTKRAGLVAALSPLLLVVGAIGNELTGRGAAHGGAVIVESFALPAVFIGLLGLNRRHGGLGLLGRFAFYAFLAAPMFSILMPWMGIVFTGTLWTLAFALIGVAMLRAAIFPRLPVILFGFSAVATIAAAGVVTAAGGDAGFFWFIPLGLQFAGFVWLGWAMWREEPLPTPGPPPWASAAA